MQTAISTNLQSQLANLSAGEKLTLATLCIFLANPDSQHLLISSSRHFTKSLESCVNAIRKESAKFKLELARRLLEEVSL